MIRRLRSAALALLGIALLSSPLAISPVEAVKKGKLTDIQKADFKQRKKEYMKQERAGLAVTRPLWPQYKKLKREYERSLYARNNSRANLDKLKAKLDAQKRKEGGMVVALNDVRYGSDRLIAMDKAYRRAEAYHDRTVRAQNIAAEAAFTPVKNRFDAARKDVDDARAKLATRRNEKNAARAASLLEANNAKAAKKLAKKNPNLGLSPGDFPTAPGQANSGNSFGGASLPMPNSQTFGAFSAPRFTPISAPRE
jgi:hypothetical protein